MRAVNVKNVLPDGQATCKAIESPDYDPVAGRGSCLVGSSARKIVAGHETNEVPDQRCRDDRRVSRSVRRRRGGP